MNNLEILLTVLLLGPLFLVGVFFTVRGECSRLARVRAWKKRHAEDEKTRYWPSYMLMTDHGKGSWSGHSVRIEPKLNERYIQSKNWKIGPTCTLALADHIIEKAKKSAAPTLRIKELTRALPYASYYSDRRDW